MDKNPPFIIKNDTKIWKKTPRCMSINVFYYIFNVIDLTLKSHKTSLLIGVLKIWQPN